MQTPLRSLVALPVFNEENHIIDVIQEVKKHCDEILVVDDGSTDGTAKVLQSLPNIHILTHPENRGYGAALKSAFDYAVEKQYDVIVTIDCDGQHEPRLIPELIQQVFPAEEEPVDIVSGSRYLKTFTGDSTPPEDRQKINQQITQIVNDRLGLSLTDTFCGFKAYRVEALQHIDITELGYALPMQFWAQAVLAGLKIIEFPVPLVYLEEERSFGGSLDDSQIRLAYYLEVLERELPSPAVSCSQEKNI
ncbi:probable dolichyl-phosphate mannose synthase [hydrothermal vent metagenome]|uniref:Probable dolichyl-phosphate mannose synthase n=1 Tax=hydrothermal vent metagenome TaxID=652676 RepID=A0A3B1DSF0_9ZZZZ